MGIVRNRPESVAAAAALAALRPVEVVDYVDAQAKAWSEVVDLANDSAFFTPPETANGPGATLANTERLREWLPGILEKYEIYSILDVACGDLNWMQHVDLGATRYEGWDVEERLIELAKERADPTMVLKVINALSVNKFAQTHTGLPSDLILCRHLMIHLTTASIVTMVEKIKASGSKYLLATTFHNARNEFVYNANDFRFLGYAERELDLTKEPFSLGEPLEIFDETPGPGGVIAQPHQLALFQLGDDR